MHTTTVRFTADQWTAIVREADRLGIARSAFVRDAVVFYLGHQAAETRISTLEGQVQKIARALALMTARTRGRGVAR